MSDGTKRLVGWAIVVAAIVGATFLEVLFPVPDAPEMAGADAVLCSPVSAGGVITLTIVNDPSFPVTIATPQAGGE